MATNSIDGSKADSAPRRCHAPQAHRSSRRHIRRLAGTFLTYGREWAYKPAASERCSLSFRRKLTRRQSTIRRLTTISLTNIAAWVQEMDPCVALCIV
jgi:hypothetical protein